MFNKSRSQFNETINNTLQQPIRENSCANNKGVCRGVILGLGAAVIGLGFVNVALGHVGQPGHCLTGPGTFSATCSFVHDSQAEYGAVFSYTSGVFLGTYDRADLVDNDFWATQGGWEKITAAMSAVSFMPCHKHNVGGHFYHAAWGYLATKDSSTFGGGVGATAIADYIKGRKPCLDEETHSLPGNALFAAPNLADAILASKGSKNAIRMGNSGFAPIGNGSLIGVGYDRADKSLHDHGAEDFSGNEYRIHLDLLKGVGNTFYGLAGEYRKGKFTLDSSGDKYETQYYGPRVDVGWRGMNSWMQLSGGYYWGKGTFDGVDGSNGHLIQAGFLAQMNKYLSRRLTLEPGVDVQYIWQKLGTIAGDTFKNRDYGRADFNVGLGVALMRGWSVTPNVGYRWDIKAACTQAGAGAKVCEPTANGVRYGVQLAKAIMTTGSTFDHLALSASYDYFNKSGVKQTMWGVLAQYPF